MWIDGGCYFQIEITSIGQSWAPHPWGNEVVNASSMVGRTYVAEVMYLDEGTGRNISIASSQGWKIGDSINAIIGSQGDEWGSWHWLYTVEKSDANYADYLFLGVKTVNIMIVATLSVIIVSLWITYERRRDQTLFPLNIENEGASKKETTDETQWKEIRFSRFVKSRLVPLGIGLLAMYFLIIGIIFLLAIMSNFWYTESFVLLMRISGWIPIVLFSLIIIRQIRYGGSRIGYDSNKIIFERKDGIGWSIRLVEIDNLSIGRGRFGWIVIRPMGRSWNLKVPNCGYEFGKNMQHSWHNVHQSIG
jgi:hypothetical protein